MVIHDYLLSISLVTVSSSCSGNRPSRFSRLTPPETRRLVPRRPIVKIRKRRWRRRHAVGRGLERHRRLLRGPTEMAVGRHLLPPRTQPRTHRRMLLHAGRLRRLGEDDVFAAGKSRVAAGNRVHVPDRRNVRTIGGRLFQMQPSQGRHRRLRTVESGKDCGGKSVYISAFVTCLSVFLSW